MTIFTAVRALDESDTCSPPDVYLSTQELVEDEAGGGVATCDASMSWDVSAEKLAGTVGKLCKAESQTLMSPR